MYYIDKMVGESELHVRFVMVFFPFKTRQDKRATAVEGNPKAPFSLASTVTYGINRNSRQGGAPLLSRCVHNLSPVILVLILPTTNGWKAE